MKANKEYLTQLILFEISGKIREDEKVTLKEMIREDQEAADLYTRLYATWQYEYLQEPSVNWGPEKVWEAIHSRRRQRLLKGSIKGLVAFFALIGVILLIKSFIFRTTGAPVLADKGHVRLQLSGGQIVDLSNQQGQLTTGHVALHNQNKELRFTTAASELQYATITVPAGKDYTVHLPDGSEVQLNAASEIIFPLRFSGNTREVTINGEAYIKVTPVASQPFIVHLPHAAVNVLGTEFNINTYDSSQVRVALVKGAVRMSTDTDTALLHPGFEAALTIGKKMSTYRFDSEEVLAWREGLHLFNHATIEEITELIHRFCGIPVILDKKPEHTNVFTGSINRNKPVVNFLEGLKFSRYADYYFDKDSTLHLSPMRDGR